MQHSFHHTVVRFVRERQRGRHLTRRKGGIRRREVAVESPLYDGVPRVTAVENELVETSLCLRRQAHADPSLLFTHENRLHLRIVADSHNAQMILEYSL